MAILFCNQPLLLHDPRGTLAAYLDSYLPTAETSFYAPPAHVLSQRQRARQRNPARVPMPAFNWPGAPRAAINTLYYPVTGATRWSVGLFLVDGNSWQKISDNIGDDGAGQLQLIDDRSGGQGKTATLAATFYALTPRQLTPDDADIPLYLLPLVDARYYWQCESINPSVDTTTTWTALIGQIASQLGVSITTSSVPSEYQNPDPLEFSRPYENAAMLLDACAASIGMRFVFDPFQDSYLVQNSDDANSATQNSQTPYDMLAGSVQPQNPLRAPGNVRVTFPEHWGHLPGGSGGLYQQSYDADSSGASLDASATPDNSEFTVHSTAAADMNGKNSGETPNNATDLQNLAKQLATDLYNWLSQNWDYSAIGLMPGAPSGFDDFYLFRIGAPGNGGYACYTRNVSLPWNVVPATNWCQVVGNSSGDDPDHRTTELWPGPRMRVQLKGDLTPGGSVACYPQMWDGTQLNPPISGGSPDAAKTITVYDAIGNLRALGRDTLSAKKANTAGANGLVEWKPDAGRWEFVSLQCLSKKLKAVVATNIVYPGDAITVNTVYPLDDGQSPVTQNSDTLSVANLPDWGAPIGAACEIAADGSGGWRLDFSEKLATLYKATTTSAVSSGSGFTVNSLTPIEPGLSPFQSADVVNVGNTAGWSTTATSGVPCIISISSKTTGEFIQGPCGR